MGRASEVLRHGRQGFCDGPAPLSIDIRLRDNHHGGGAVGSPEVGSGDHDFIQFGRLLAFGADRRIDQYEDCGAALPIAQPAVSEHQLQRRLWRVVAADGRRLATRHKRARVKDLQTALAAEGGQRALQRPGGDVEAPDAVRRLCDHRRRDCQHQRGERG